MWRFLISTLFLRGFRIESYNAVFAKYTRLLSAEIYPFLCYACDVIHTQLYKLCQNILVHGKQASIPHTRQTGYTHGKQATHMANRLHTWQTGYTHSKQATHMANICYTHGKQATHMANIFYTHNMHILHMTHMLHT